MHNYSEEECKDTIDTFINIFHTSRNNVSRTLSNLDIENVSILNDIEDIKREFDETFQKLNSLFAHFKY